MDVSLTRKKESKYQVFAFVTGGQVQMVKKHVHELLPFPHVNLFSSVGHIVQRFFESHIVQM